MTSDKGFGCPHENAKPPTNHGNMWIAASRSIMVPSPQNGWVQKHSAMILDQTSHDLRDKSPLRGVQRNLALPTHPLTTTNSFLHYVLWDGIGSKNVLLGRRRIFLKRKKYDSDANLTMFGEKSSFDISNFDISIFEPQIFLVNYLGITLGSTWGTMWCQVKESSHMHNFYIIVSMIHTPPQTNLTFKRTNWKNALEIIPTKSTLIRSYYFPTNKTEEVNYREWSVILIFHLSFPSNIYILTCSVKMGHADSPQLWWQNS